ncbi:MAG: nickel-type superoxide dismutase maturation protease [Tepidiformaceae bacterium]
MRWARGAIHPCSFLNRRQISGRTRPLKREPGRAAYARARAFAFGLCCAAVVAVLAMACARRFQRFEIRGESMLPVLRPGDFVIIDTRGFGRRLPLPGAIVLARDPRSPARLIVKRVGRIDLHGGVWLTGDNAAASTDSRTFGPVPPALIIGRVRWRYSIHDLRVTIDDCAARPPRPTEPRA